MISPKDAGLLAFTKLRTRKVRLIVTIIISGLLFCVLATVSLIARGAFDSIGRYNEDGLGSKYLTVATIENLSQTETARPSVIKRAEEIHKQTVDAKKKEAERLDILYDPDQEPKPVFEGGPDGEKEVDTQTPAGFQAIKEFEERNPKPGEEELREITEKYNPLGFYQIKSLNLQGAMTDPSAQPGNIAVLKDGKEDYENSEQDFFSFDARGLDSFVSSWKLASSEILSPFVISDSTLEIDEEKTVPVLAPYTAAEELLDLKPLPQNAPADEKINRLSEVRQGIKDFKFDVCYRNGASVESIQQTTDQRREISENKDNKDYLQPALQYGLPKNSCGKIRITKDTRSDEEKELAKKQRQFDRKFGVAAPSSRIISFRVVGTVPDPPDYAVAQTDQLLSSLFGSTLGESGWYSPIDIEGSNKLIASFFTDSPGSSAITPTNYITEFASAEDAQAFIEENSCEPQDNGEADVFAGCPEDEESLFTVRPFGSSSLALDQLSRQFTTFFGIAALAVGAVAAIIMMGTVGRIIADGRRETAVFRAIGAKRLDIAQIYLNYVIMLAALISVFSIAIGTALAMIANMQWSADLSIRAMLIYNVQDLSIKFSLFSYELADIALLVGLIFVAGLISAILPLAVNLRRNPINDMRDEN